MRYVRVKVVRVSGDGAAIVRYINPHQVAWVAPAGSGTALVHMADGDNYQVEEEASELAKGLAIAADPA